MKKIFGKNQVIITALAIMIAVAGYLSVTEENADNAAKLASTDSQEPSFANIPEAGTDGVTYDISDVDSIQDYSATDSGEVISDDAVENAAANTAGGETSADGITADGNTGIVSDGTTTNTDNTAVDADTSDNSASGADTPSSSMNEAASEVAANDGDKSSNVGEAVMVSGTIGAEYFAQAKLSREQTRSKNKEILMEIVNSTTASKKQKDKAVSEVMALTADSEKETAAETMLEAKGYKDSIVSIVDGSADVIVNACDLTEKDIAQIEDIVKRKTSIDVSKIVITPVGVQ